MIVVYALTGDYLKVMCEGYVWRSVRGGAKRGLFIKATHGEGEAAFVVDGDEADTDFVALF